LGPLEAKPIVDFASSTRQAGAHPLRFFV